MGRRSPVRPESPLVELVGGVRRNPVTPPPNLIASASPAENHRRQCRRALLERLYIFLLIAPGKHPGFGKSRRIEFGGCNLIGERTLDPLAAGSHFSKFISELFEDQGVVAQAQEMEGLLTVESDQPLVAVTLRQNDAPGQDFPE